MSAPVNVVRRRPAPAPGRTAALRCSFTGSRPQKLPCGFDEEDPRCADFRLRLCGTIERLIAQGYTHFLSGGALGMDLWAGEAVLDLRETHPEIGLEMVVPFDGQADRWSPALRERHRRLLAECDIVTCTAHAYGPRVMLLRNRYLVDNCDLLLAAWNGLPGGTQMTVSYARSIGVPVRCILPVLEELRSSRGA